MSLTLTYLLFSNSSVFNYPEDSDIILQCGAERFYAHRVILRLWSPFFARTLNSKFPVAKSAVFEIDDDDYAAHEPFCAVLKHMYGMNFGQHPVHEDYEYENSHSAFEHSIRVYMAADKYDVPSVRLAAVASAETYLEIGDGPCIPEWIANICGPEAPQLANEATRNTLFDWVKRMFDSVIEDPEFLEKIEEGSLLDVELSAKLLVALGTKIVRLNEKSKARRVQY